MNSVFESVDGVKKLPSPVWMGIIQFIEAFNRTKCWRANSFFFFFCPQTKELLVLRPINSRNYILWPSCSGWELLEHHLFPGSQTLGLGLPFTTGIPYSYTCRVYLIGEKVIFKHLELCKAWIMHKV